MENTLAKTKQTGHANQDATRVPGAGPGPELHPALQLQQQAGNQAVQQLLREGVIRAKLTISQPGDLEEQEADATADHIMRSHVGADAAATPCSCGTDEEGMCAQCRQKAAGISRKATHSGPAISSHPLLASMSRSSGHPLDGAARAFFEPRFGRDFSNVRIHTDASASDSAHSIQAHAFTAGSEIFFGAGQYSPHTDSGRMLLAHELTHVVQQDSRPSGVLHRQTKAPQGVEAEDPDAPPVIEDVFAGKSYDRKTKEGALDYAKDWHTQFLRNYQPYMTEPYDHAPEEFGISFSKQQRTGRAFFIYTVHYWPDIQKQADSLAPAAIFQLISDDVNATNRECETEAESAKRIDPASYRTLFPETFAQDYDAEAKKSREEAARERDSEEKWKTEAAKKKDKSTFVLFGAGEYRPIFYADLLEAEAARIRKGQWSSLGFTDHKVFFWMDADTKAETVAGSEYDAYIEQTDDPSKAWTEALDTKQQWRGDLDKQNKDDEDTSATEKDLVQLTVIASLMRNKVGREVLSAEVIDSWNTADMAMISIAPAVNKDDLSDDVQTATKEPVEIFFEELWGAVAAPQGPVTDADLDDLIVSARINLQHAHTKSDWKVVFADYNDVVEAMDNYISSELTAKGKKDEADQLTVIGSRARALNDLLQDHPDAQKVRAVFYPKDQLQNTGDPGTPNFSALGIPLYFYLYRESGEWNLVDITTPHQVKVTSGSGGTFDSPDMSIFADVNSKLRFPDGRIEFYLPNGTAWRQVCNTPWRLSEWLSWIGIGIAAIGLAIVTMGASIPAELILLGAAVGVAAGVSDMAEKKSAGVLTTKDIAVDGLQIAASLLTAGSMKLGQVVVSEAVAAGISVAEVGGLAGKLFVPITLAAAGVDVTSFAVLTADSIAAMKQIDDQPGTAEDKKLSKLRLIAQWIGMGTLTFLGVRGSIKTAGMGMHIGLGPGGELAASALLGDEELLQSAGRMKNAGDITKLLGDESLSQDLRDRIRAAFSHALTNGPIAERKLDELVARLRAAKTPDAINSVLDEMAARSRIGALSDGNVAARISAEDAAAIGQLKEEVLQGLKGASPRDLESLAKVLKADPHVGARLVAEYGPEIIEYLRTNPMPELGQLEDILAKKRAEVTTRVKDLAESIDTTKPPEGGWKFDDGRGVYTDSDGVTKVIETTVRGPNGAEGFFERAYNPVTKQLELRMAFMRMRGQKKALPSMIGKQGSAPEMVAGKGTPTLQYLTIYQMKLLGVPVGEGAAGLRSIHMSNIQNVETIVHLHWLQQKYPGMAMDQLIEFTPSLKYADTTATQTGYTRSGTPKVTGGEQSPIREIMAHQENGKPDLIAKNKALLDQYGFDRKTVMYMKFDVDFQVVPKP